MLVPPHFAHGDQSLTHAETEREVRERRSAALAAEAMARSADSKSRRIFPRRSSTGRTLSESERMALAQQLHADVALVAAEPGNHSSVFVRAAQTVERHAEALTPLLAVHAATDGDPLRGTSIDVLVASGADTAVLAAWEAIMTPTAVGEARVLRLLRQRLLMGIGHHLHPTPLMFTLCAEAAESPAGGRQVRI